MRIEHKCTEYEITDNVSIYEIIGYNKDVCADMADYYIKYDIYPLQYCFGVEPKNRFSYTDLVNLFHNGWFDHIIADLEAE